MDLIDKYLQKFFKLILFTFSVPVLALYMTYLFLVLFVAGVIDLATGKTSAVCWVSGANAFEDIFKGYFEYVLHRLHGRSE